MTMKPLLTKWFPNLMTPSGGSDEQNPGDMAGLSGRLPTIGSGPTRPNLAVDQEERAWMSMAEGMEDIADEKASSSKAVSLRASSGPSR